VRIAYVVYGDLNQLAGNPVHTLEITKAWVKQGHEVTLIVPTFGVPRVANGARVLSVPTIGGGARGSLVFGLLTPLVLAGLRLRHEMDAVYASQMSLVVSPLLACLLLGIPYVTEVQGHLRNEIAMRRPDPVKDLVAGVTEWLTLRWSHAVVAVSQGVARALADTYGVSPSRLFVVPNGVDVHTYRPMDRSSCRRELGIPEAAKVVGFVGAFYTYQRADRIVCLAPRILQACPDAHFVLVGDGPKLVETKRLADRLGVGARFTFAGAVPAQLCAKYVNTFDVGVGFHDPKQDGSPMKLLNYLACGKPVVTTRSSGTRYVEEHGLGLLVTSEDPVQVARSVFEVLYGGQFGGSFAAQSSHHIAKHHSWDNAGRAIVSVLRSVSRRCPAHGATA